MASTGTAPASMAPASAIRKPAAEAMIVDKLPEEINEMKIRDEKVEKVGFSIICRRHCLFIVSFFSSSMYFLC